jgi:hypothetical protein
MNDQQNLQQQIDELKKKVEALYSSTGFPLEVKQALIKQGFLNYISNLNFTLANGRESPNILVEYKEKKSIVNVLDNLKSITANPSTNEIICINHGFTPYSASPAYDGDQVTFWTTDNLPAPLVNGVRFYVKTATQSSFTLASTPNGTTIDITDVGLGNNYVTYY